MSFVQAAALPVSGVTALQAVRDWAGVRPGQKGLINGASGGLGSFAVQIAKALGAEVTGVCSTGSAGLVRSLGADMVIDYTREDFTRGMRRYDVILDVPHVATCSLTDLRRALTPRRTLIPASNTRNRWIGGFSRVIPARLIAPFMPYHMRAPEMAPNQADLAALADLSESGKLTPVIDRTYPLAQAPAVLRHFEQGHPRKDRHHHLERDPHAAVPPTRRAARTRSLAALAARRASAVRLAVWTRIAGPGVVLEHEDGSLASSVVEGLLGRLYLDRLGPAGGQLALGCGRALTVVVPRPIWIRRAGRRERSRSTGPAARSPGSGGK
jgi:Zinc-binding dehydrogenase